MLAVSQALLSLAWHHLSLPSRVWYCYHNYISHLALGHYIQSSTSNNDALLYFLLQPSLIASVSILSLLLKRALSSSSIEDADKKIYFLHQTASLAHLLLKSLEFLRVSVLGHELECSINFHRRTWMCWWIVGDPLERQNQH